MSKNNIEKFMEDIVDEADSTDELDITASKFKTKERDAPILIIDIKYGLEAEYLKEILINKENYEGDNTLIEVCVPLSEGYKPLGYIEFTFESILSIKSYGNFNMWVKDEEEVELTERAILMIP